MLFDILPGVTEIAGHHILAHTAPCAVSKQNYCHSYSLGYQLVATKLHLLIFHFHSFSLEMAFHIKVYF